MRAVTTWILITVLLTLGCGGGADIEYAAIRADGAVLGEPVIARSTWVELRGHASFPAAIATREWTVRETALGTFEGWLYRVEEDGTREVNELFFASALPGAPVHITTFDDGDEVFELEQLERSSPVVRPSTERPIGGAP